MTLSSPSKTNTSIPTQPSDTPSLVADRSEATDVDLPPLPAWVSDDGVKLQIETLPVPATTASVQKENVYESTIEQPSIPLDSDKPNREARRWSPAIVAIPTASPNINIEPMDIPLESPRPAMPSEAVAEEKSEVTAMDVELTYRDAHVVKLPGIVRKVDIEDESVCRAMSSDPSGIMLLGVGCGKTNVKVWMSTSAEAAPSVRVIRVAVNEAWSAASLQRGTTLAEATQLIIELFPTSRIAIRSNENGSLTIFGRTDNDEQAKQIASLVRKMFLVPIEDRIAVVSTP
jgi:hypothetical protein